MVSQLIVNGISIGAVYALIAVGFAIVFSIMRFSNFAHGGMISACAFIGFFNAPLIHPRHSTLPSCLQRFAAWQLPF